MAIEDALVLSQEIAKLNLAPDAVPDGTPRRNLPLALQNYQKNRVLRAAAVQGLSRVSSAFLFQYQPPLDIEWGFPPKIKNTGPRSLITRACQGFLQNVAFPLQFEFLFSFPGRIDPEVFDAGCAGDFGTPEASSVSQLRAAKSVDQIGAVEKEFSGAVSGGTKGVKEWLDKYW